MTALVSPGGETETLVFFIFISSYLVSPTGPTLYGRHLYRRGPAWIHPPTTLSKHTVLDVPSCDILIRSRGVRQFNI